MTTLYGTSLPPGLESSTKGELRIRIDKLILDDEALNNNPLLQTSFAQSTRNHITDLKARRSPNGSTNMTTSDTTDSANRNSSGNSSFVNKRKFCVPVDYCSLSPHFWGEAKPSASCIPATPRQLQRGAITIIYLVKVKESAFAEYLHNMTCSSHRGLHLDVFVPSSYSGRKPVFVGQCVIDLDDLIATKHLDGWFTLIHNTNVDLNELSSKKNESKEENSTKRDNENGVVPNAKVHDELTAICTSIPIGKVKVSFQLVYFSEAPVRLLHKKKSNRVSFILPNKENEHYNNVQEKNNNSNNDDNDQTTQKLSSSTPAKLARDEHKSNASKSEQTNVNDEKWRIENNINNLAKHREERDEEEEEEEEEENKGEEQQEEEKISSVLNETRENENTEDVDEHISNSISKTDAQGKEYDHMLESNKLINNNNNNNSGNNENKGSKTEQTTWPLPFNTSSSSTSSSFASTLDELLHKSKLLRDRMAQAITLDSKVRHSSKAIYHNNNHGDGDNINEKNKKNNNVKHVKNEVSTEEKPQHPSTVIIMDSNSESSNSIDANNENDEEDEILYTSELSDDEDRLLQLEGQQNLNKYTAYTPVNQTPIQESKLNSHVNGEVASAPTSHVRLVSSAQPTLFARDEAIMLNHKAMSLPADYMRKRNIMGCTLVELHISNLSFAANMKTTDLSKLRINVKLSADITTSTPTAGPFSSFVHALPLRQPSICLSFDIQSYSEDVSRLVIEFFKVSTVSTSVRDNPTLYTTHVSTSSSCSSSSEEEESSSPTAAANVLVHTPKHCNHRHPKGNRPMHNNQEENDHNYNHCNNNNYKEQHSNARKEERYAKRHQVEETTGGMNHQFHAAHTTTTNRDVINEELLGLCIVGLYSQERTIALRDPVGDVVNVYAHLQLALREPNNVNDSKKTEKQYNNSVIVNDDLINTEHMTNGDSNNSKGNHRHYHHNIRKENYDQKQTLNGINHEGRISELPSNIENSDGSIIGKNGSSGLQGNAYKFNQRINRKYITETNKCIRLRVEIVNAQDIPLVCVEKNDRSQRHVMHTTSIEQNTDAKQYEEPARYTKPNTFCVIDDVYMKSNVNYSNGRNGRSDSWQLDYLSPVEDWYVESFTNGYYDRSEVIWHTQRPQYNYSCVLTIIEDNSTYKSERSVEKEQANNSSSIVHYSTIGPGKTDNNIVLSNLHEVSLTLWHCALPLQKSTTPNKNKKVLSYAERDVNNNVDEHRENYDRSAIPFDPNNETLFWAHSGELGECRVDLHPLRYLSTLDGYYSVVAKKRDINNNNSNKGEDDRQNSYAPQSHTDEQVIGYLHVCISLL